MPEAATIRPQTAGSQLAVERYFEVSLFLLVATGFLTLAGTGKLDALSLLLVSAVLVARGALLAKDRKPQLPESWTTYATLAYAAFYVLDFFLLSASFVRATVHLVLFVLAVKLFSLQRDRDYFYLAAISLGMVLIAAVFTVDSAFVFEFCLFLLLATTTFISMEMRRSARAAQMRAHELPAAKKAVSRSLSFTALLLVVATAAGAGLLFFVLPRSFSGGYLNQLAEGNQFVTGFGNDVQLGRIGEIKQSSAIVMHIRILNGQNVPQGLSSSSISGLKWRGVALSRFDGKRWSNPLERRALLPERDGVFHLEGAQPPRVKPRFRPPQMQYHVLMEPVGLNAFFLAPIATTIAGHYRVLSVDTAGSVTSEDQPIGVYDGFSDVALPDVAQLRAANGDISAQTARQYLQLPKLDGRITQLAARVSLSSGAGSRYDQAVALEKYLRSNYGYTLQLPSTPPADPVADFLFNRKRGHCEYFASALAVMLRTQGIPSRLVNGFHNGEFNDLTSSYIVRGSDAHTWVEAYFPPYGWVDFDPTPPDPLPANHAWSRMMMYVDAMSEFWREWVINYDFTRQLGLDRQVFSGGRRYLDRARLWVERRYQQMLRGARQAEVGGTTRRLGWGLFVTATLVLLAVAGRDLGRAWRNNRIASRPEQAPRAAASLWYVRMTGTLARRGCPKSPTQTPAEFVQAIPEGNLRHSVAAFTQHYERARFGELAEDAKRLPELFEEIQSSR